MPAYSFKAQFCPKVEDGSKAHTIRGKRKHRPRVGQKWFGYYAMRTKQCRKLGESVITKVGDIWITQSALVPSIYFVEIDGVCLTDDECERLALADGFDSFAHMMSFWDGRRPFNGDIIHWKPLGGGSDAKG